MISNGGPEYPDPAAGSCGSVSKPRGYVVALREVLRVKDFRKLIATRLMSQSGDGLLQVGLASLFFFSPERATTASGIAAALAVSVLPYTVLGPFVGVLLDRWRRRQVLLVGNAVRSVLTIGIAGLVLAHVVGPVLYTTVLACLSVNRFLLAGLGASLPQVVDPRELVMANAVTPTSGTLAAILGAGIGFGARVALGPGDTGDAVVTALAALAYAIAAALALRLHRDLLGPDRSPGEPAGATPEGSPAAATGSATGSERHHTTLHDHGKVRGHGEKRWEAWDGRGLADLRAGLEHLRHRPIPATALASIGVHRFGFGSVTVMTILLCRYRLVPEAAADRGFALLAVAVGLTGAGYILAALVTPRGSVLLGPQGWITCCLLVTATLPAMLAVAPSIPTLLMTSFLFGLAGQGTKICVDALVQTGIDDRFRGRAFSVYDLVFNATFVAAATGSALVLPTDGYAPGWFLALTALYLTAAIAYNRANRGFPVAPDRAPEITFPGSG